VKFADFELYTQKPKSVRKSQILGSVRNERRVSKQRHLKEALKTIDRLKFWGKIKSVNNRIGIWGTGCIAFELFNGFKLFLNDWAVLQTKNYFEEGYFPGITIAPHLHSFIGEYSVKRNGSDNLEFPLESTLASSPLDRPSAKDIV